MLSACMYRKTTEAKASLSSHRSMSFLLILAFFRTFSLTGIGPVNMIAGSEPILANCRIRARGLAGGLAADQHSCGAVDDARGIAGSMHVVDRFDFRVALNRDRIEARHF